MALKYMEQPAIIIFAFFLALGADSQGAVHTG